jgi:hypothetical protein
LTEAEVLVLIILHCLIVRLPTEVIILGVPEEVIRQSLIIKDAAVPVTPIDGNTPAVGEVIRHSVRNNVPRLCAIA